MSVTAAASGFVVFLLSVPVIQGQDDYGVTYTSTEICALKGSTVDIGCSYTYPSIVRDKTTKVDKKIWFTKGSNKDPLDLTTDRDYTGRVEYLFHDDDDCTLRIKDLRESDSAVYKFRFITNQDGGKVTGSPGVTLSVTDLQVQVKRSSTEAELKCHSRCNIADHTSYVWYNNGKNMNVETSSQRVSVNDNDNYSCAVKGHEDHRSPPVYAPKLSPVSVSPSGEILENSSVTLTCSSDANPAATYTWYKENGHLRSLSEEQQLVLRSIQSSDSGQYYCTAENEVGTTSSESIFINVKYAPKLLSVSASPSRDVEEGSSVTLTCRSDANPVAKYTWHKKNQHFRLLSEEQQLVLGSIQSSDSGEYYCTAENDVGTTSSQSIFINVKYAPKLPSVSASPSRDVVEGRSVTLTCSSDANPVATYTWYKKSKTPGLPPSKQTRNVQSSRNQLMLVLSSIRSFDSGEYYCTAENDVGATTSQSISINVKYAPKLPSVSASPSRDVVEGRSVTLTCSSDANPVATYTWYKKSKTPGLLPSKQTRNVQSSRNQLMLVLSSIRSFDSGEYYCTAENDVRMTTSKSIFINVKYAPKLLSVSARPSHDVKEGSSVTLTCRSDANPVAKYTWHKKKHLRPLSEEKHLVLRSIQSSDSGEYYCTAENRLGKESKDITINVKYAPKPPSVSVSPSGEIMEGSSVTLTCSSDANPAATYTWYKESKDPGLLPSKQTQTVQSSGNQSKLIFSSIQSSDSGQYYCTAANRLRRTTSSFIFIDVKYAPKTASASVSPSAEIVEGSSVTLTCSSDANPAATYTWCKENQTLLQGPEGIYHFTSISTEDRGSYHCKSENQHGQIDSSFLFVDVQYAPRLPSVSVSPSAEIVEGSSVNLTCSSDANPAANYTWYIENDDSPKASGQIFTVTDFRAEHSGNYYCEAQNTRGRHSFTIYLAVGAKSWTLIAAATVSAIVLTVLLISVSLWIMKKRASKQPSGERPDTREQLQLAEQPNELHYATVRFAKKPAQPRRHEEAENIVYTVVKFNNASPASRSAQEAVEDPAALYSTVTKKRDL